MNPEQQMKSGRLHRAAAVARWYGARRTVQVVGYWWFTEAHDRYFEWDRK